MDGDRQHRPSSATRHQSTTDNSANHHGVALSFTCTQINTPTQFPLTMHPHLHTVENQKSTHLPILACSPVIITNNMPSRLRRRDRRPRRVPRPWLHPQGPRQLHRCQVQSKHVLARPASRTYTTKSRRGQGEAESHQEGMGRD